MGQFFFFTLFVIALIAGAFAYFAPLQKPISPVKFMMDNTGYTTEETSNRKRIQKFNMSTNSGLMQVRRQMDDLALGQNKIMDTLQDQQQMLQDTGKNASDIILMTQQGALKGGQDVLHLQALTTEMQDEQRLLVAHGQELMELNNQLTKSRQWIADQIDLSNINNQNSFQMLEERYIMLKDQATGFFDKVTQHNQEVRDRINKLQDQLNDVANNAASNSEVQQQNIKERIERMMDKEHQDMQRLADSQERSRNLLKDAQQSFEDSKELFNDSLQHSQDIIAEERQKIEDQAWINKQRMADQMQKIQDQQDR